MGNVRLSRGKMVDDSVEKEGEVIVSAGREQERGFRLEGKERKGLGWLGKERKNLVENERKGEGSVGWNKKEIPLYLFS